MLRPYAVWSRTPAPGSAGAQRLASEKGLARVERGAERREAPRCYGLEVPPFKPHPLPTRSLVRGGQTRTRRKSPVLESVPETQGTG
jgi:hypothetical protein